MSTTIYELWMTGGNSHVPKDFFEGLVKLAESKAPVDFAAILRVGGFPVTDAAEGQLFRYHFEFGLLTVNEGRKFLGLPPVPDGDVVATAQTPSDGTKEQ